MMDFLMNLDTIHIAIPFLPYLIPLLQLNSGDVIIDGTKAFHGLNSMRKPFVRVT